VKIHLLTIGDGRDEVHDRSWASLQEQLPLPVASHFVVDDRDHELGFAGAIRHGWENVPADADYVAHCELDFIYHAPIPLDRMCAVLKRRPYLAQIALKRQPINEAELAAGGIVETDPDSFEQIVDGGDIWTEHRRCFSTNPCVYPAALCRQGWPQESESEGKFTHRLLGDPKVRFAFWGAKLDAPLVEHIGVRCGVGY
jgi:hypothetical protein